MSFGVILRIMLGISLIGSNSYANNGDLGDCQKYLRILTGEEPALIAGEYRRILDRSFDIDATNHDSTALFLESEVKKMGYAVELQSWEINTWKEMPRSGWYDWIPPPKFKKRTAKNLIVTLQPDQITSDTILIGAHYDVVNSRSRAWRGSEYQGYRNAPGADDNGSGVTALLLLLKRFKDIPVQSTLKFVFFDSEEISPVSQGLAGSYYFRSQLEPREFHQLKQVIILDMIGKGDREFPHLFNLSAANIHEDQLSKLIGAEKDRFFARPFVQFPFEKDFLIPLSDARPFAEAGVNSILITDVLSIPRLPPHYHSEDDKVEIIDWTYMMSIIDRTELMIRKLAQNP